MKACPRCGGHIHYEGAFNVECMTRGCKNFAVPRNLGKMDDDTFSFERALFEHERGSKLEFMRDGDWHQCVGRPDWQLHTSNRWRVAKERS